MAANNSQHYNRVFDDDARDQVRLAAITAEKGKVNEDGEAYDRLVAIEADLTARLLNNTARLAHYDGFETN